MLILEEYRDLDDRYMEGVARIIRHWREANVRKAKLQKSVCELILPARIEVRTTTHKSYTVRDVKSYYADSEHKHVFMDEQKQVIAIISNVADMFFGYGKER